MGISAAEFKRIRHEAAIKSWRTRRRNSGDRPLTKSASERTSRLRSLKVESAKVLAGGVSKTWSVRFADGSMGVLRHSERRGTDAADVAAWEMANAVGMGDMVPAAVIREIEVPRKLKPGFEGGNRPVTGALCEWQEGELPWAGDYGDSDHDIHRAAVFDAMSGNVDRHDGNLVVDDGRLRLIDHNLCFEPGGGVASNLVDRSRKLGLTREQFQALVKPYAEKRGQIKTRLLSAGLNDKQVAAFETRLDIALVSSGWRDFFAKLRMKL